LIGASGVIVDTLVLVLCREALGMDIRLAAIPAFLVAVSWNYELNRRITFRSEADQRQGSAYLAFVIICTLGLGVRILSMHLLIVHLGMSDQRHLALLGFAIPWLRLSYIANFIGIFNASLFNFLGSKFLVFAPTKKEV
jgi:putative flippase GtrA